MRRRAPGECVFALLLRACFRKNFCKIKNMFSRKLIYKIFCQSVFSLVCLSAPAGLSARQTSSDAPVKKDKLVKVLRSKQYQAREIAKIIAEQGVDFQLTPDVQAELVGAGARPEVLEAVRRNYRAAPIANIPKKAAASINPLSSDQIIALLKKDGDAAARRKVQSNGVNFRATPQILNEITRAGGSVALLKLVSIAFVNAGNGGAGNNVGKASGYDNLIDKALELYGNQHDKQGAIDVLRQAVNLNPSNSRAFQLLGSINLYGLGNFVEAERNMREAIRHGGSAVFRVFHDHNGTFTFGCEGSLYVAADTVRYEADDNRHTFQTLDADIKEVKTNGTLRRLIQIKNGSFKIVLRNRADDDDKKFNFAPLTNKMDESKMIIRLIGKN